MPINAFRLLAVSCVALSILHTEMALAGNFLDEKGNQLASDGINNDSLYVIKTSQRNFAGGGRAAGISPEEANKAKAFVFKWKGIPDSFLRNPWIYSDFQAIEWRDSIRQQMLDIVSKDDGPGENPRNNREFGGTVAANHKVLQQGPGPVSISGQDAHITIIIASNTIADFHSHPSGHPRAADLSTGDRQTMSMSSTADPVRQNLCDYNQPPSPDDIEQIGIRPAPDGAAGGAFAGEVVGYIFGMCDKNVYIYTNKGITAMLPRDRFVNYKRITLNHK